MQNAILIACVVVFSYMLLYRNNKFLGNLFFILSAMATFVMSDISSIIGMVMLAIALISMVYDIFDSISKTNSARPARG
jgi:hypothetical protein